MKNRIETAWKGILDHRYNPLRQMQPAQRDYAMRALGWTWSTIFSLSFLSIYAFGYVWVSHLLIIGGVFVTFAIFERARSRREPLAPVPNLSRASKCVWQMDREA